MPSASGRVVTLSARERLLWAEQVFVVLLLVWLALNGLERAFVGLVTVSLSAALAGWIATVRPAPIKTWQLPGFALFFVIESLRGGVEVAWRALHPALPIEPQFASFDLDLPPGQPRTLFVSTLSLMPGTLSAELSDDGATLVVHALTTAALASVPRLQGRVRRLFGLAPHADGAGA